MKLRITTDGDVRGLYNDELDWSAMGHLAIQRASHVEFCVRRQQWIVRAGRPRSALRRLLQRLTGRPMGEILHTSQSRAQALAWERRHFEPGGKGWSA